MLIPLPIFGLQDNKWPSLKELLECSLLGAKSNRRFREYKKFAPQNEELRKRRVLEEDLWNLAWEKRKRLQIQNTDHWKSWNSGSWLKITGTWDTKGSLLQTFQKEKSQQLPGLILLGRSHIHDRLRTFRESPGDASKLTTGCVPRAPILVAPTVISAGVKLPQDYRRAFFQDFCANVKHIKSCFKVFRVLINNFRNYNWSIKSCP